MKNVDLGEFIFSIPDNYDANKLKRDIAVGKFKRIYNKILISLTEIDSLSKEKSK